MARERSVGVSPPDALPASLRVDKWLWFARFFKTRSLAASTVEAGLVRLNGTVVTRTAHGVRPGDELEFLAGRGSRRVRVVALGERRGPAPEARTLYDELPLS